MTEMDDWSVVWSRDEVVQGHCCAVKLWLEGWFAQSTEVI